MIDAYDAVRQSYELAVEYLSFAERMYDPDNPIRSVETYMILVRLEDRNAAALAAAAQQAHDLFKDAQTVAADQTRTAAQTRPGKTGISL